MVRDQETQEVSRHPTYSTIKKPPLETTVVDLQPLTSKSETSEGGITEHMETERTALCRVAGIKLNIGKMGCKAC